MLFKLSENFSIFFISNPGIHPPKLSLPYHSLQSASSLIPTVTVGDVVVVVEDRTDIFSLLLCLFNTKSKKNSNNKGISKKIYCLMI